MFEDAVFESTGRIHTGSHRWMIATFALNGAILLMLVLIPLIYPEALPQHALSMLLTAPPAPTTRPPMPKDQMHPIQGASEMLPAVNFAAPILQLPVAQADNAQANNDHPFSMNVGPATPDAATGIFTSRLATRVTQAEVKGPVRVSSGVMEGTAIYKTNPVYPAIALAARVEGTVVLQATISKNGTIENLRVESGPGMLQPAAIDAVKQWRYRPFLLNGSPVEVETTVNVVFSLGR